MSGRWLSIWKCDPVKICGIVTHIFYVDLFWECSESHQKGLWLSVFLRTGCQQKKIVDKVTFKYLLFLVYTVNLHRCGRSMLLTTVSQRWSYSTDRGVKNFQNIFFPILVNSKNTVIMSVKVFEKKSCLETAFLWCYNLSASARILGIYRKPFGFHCIGSRCVISTIYLIYKYLVKIKMILRLPIQCYLRYFVNEYVCKQTIDQFLEQS